MIMSPTAIAAGAAGIGTATVASAAGVSQPSDALIGAVVTLVLALASWLRSHQTTRKTRSTADRLDAIERRLTDLEHRRPTRKRRTPTPQPDKDPSS